MSTCVQAWLHASASCRAAASEWRSSDSLEALVHDASRASLADSIRAEFLIEVRDHATSRIQAICLAMALHGIHKT